MTGNAASGLNKTKAALPYAFHTGEPLNKRRLTEGMCDNS